MRWKANSKSFNLIGCGLPSSVYGKKYDSLKLTLLSVLVKNLANEILLNLA